MPAQNQQTRELTSARKMSHGNSHLACTKYINSTRVLHLQTCLVYAIGVEIYTLEAQTTHLRLHYTNYANDFISAMR